MEFLCEHVVVRKKEGAYRFLKTAILAAWIVVPLIAVLFCTAIAQSNPSLAFLNVSIFFLPFFVFLAAKIGPITAAYGEISYEYSIASGEMEFSKIYGDRFRKKWFEVKLSDMEIIAPYDGMYADKADNGSYGKVYKAISSFDANNIYYGVWDDENGVRCIVFFEMIPKSLKMARSYNRSTVYTRLVMPNGGNADSAE